MIGYGEIDAEKHRETYTETDWHKARGRGRHTGRESQTYIERLRAKNEATQQKGVL